MRHQSSPQFYLRWLAFGFALIMAATIALLSTSHTVAYHADLQGDPMVSQNMPDPAPDVDSWDSPKLLNKARNVLANRLSVSPADPEFVNQEAVRWPDTSLGCPQPGFAYAKVIVPGYRFTFSHDGNLYEVHTGSEDGIGSNLPPVSCEGDWLTQPEVGDSDA